MPLNRSDPDAVLQQIQQEEAQSKVGKLKIYLGSAPGVGKTYKMLHDAYLNRVKNLDVVIGIVESHGRQAIDRMIGKLESISPQVVTYRDKQYVEFDLDAALARNPGLILMDEMAHTNVSGLRHEKRWQDIKELLDRGIDVYTTLNVQHIESLKDDVAQIIQAPVKETVPDSMIERANAIELVDLPVDDLLKRLKEGKIYIPEQATLAADHFFREGNLIALRELALRAMAHFVESDVMSYRKTEKIQDIWPTVDKILVCVGSSTQSLKLIRTAKQLANGLQAEWIAIYIDSPNMSVSKSKRNRAIQNLRFAEQLGAVTHVLVGRDIVKEILQCAREFNVTQIMLSKDRTHVWRYFFRRRLADVLIANSGEINVYIVGGKKIPEPLTVDVTYSAPDWRYYGLSIIAVVLATGINSLLASFLAVNMMVLIYLLAVMAIALLGRLGPSLLASVLSVLVCDFYFVDPAYHVNVASMSSMTTLATMFAVALVISYLTALKHREAQIARGIQQQTRALYDFSQKLLKTRGMNKILSLGVRYIADSLQSGVMALMPKERRLIICASSSHATALDEKDHSVAQWVYDMAQPAGLGTDTLASAEALYMPLSTSSKKAMGVLRILPHEKMLFSPEQMHLLESFINQLTLAMEMDRLQEKYRKKQLKLEVDTAKNALLKTISVQLNYPLKFILGVIGSSMTRRPRTTGPSVAEELNKISLINNNILQVIEFEKHQIHLEKQMIDLAQLIETTLEQFRKTNHKRSIQVHYAATLPKVNLDPVRIQEVLLNLLDNAIKYSPQKSGIDLYVQVQLSHILVSIENMGSGIAAEALSRIFHPFYRGESLSHPGGLGLGLTLCQINIEAHGGQIWAENIEEKGSVAVRFTLPY